MPLPTLLSLPSEIISRIATHLIPDESKFYPFALDLTGLYALRLTCRTLNAKTLYEFSKVAFSTLVIDFFPSTLDQLDAISRHPDFSQAVKCIYFAHHAEPVVWLGEAEDAVEGDPGSTFESRIHEAVKAGLERVFKRLTQLRDIVIIAPFAAIYRQHRTSLSLSDVPQTFPPAAATAEQNIAIVNKTPATLSITQTSITANILVRYVLSAADTALLRLHTLELRAPTNHWLKLGGDRTAAYGACAHSLVPMHPSLSRLQKLRLALDPSETGLCRQWPEPPHSALDAALRQSLCAMPHLNELAIAFTDRLQSPLYPGSISSPETQRVMRALGTVCMPRLTRLHISNAGTDRDVLIQILGNHRESLETVLLQGITVVGSGSWRAVLEGMVEGGLGKLRELRLEAVYERGGIVAFPSTEGQRRVCEVCVSGPGMVEGLRGLVSALRYEDD